MGSDELYYKKREKRKTKEINFAKQKINKWLIVSEGTDTEPNYFSRILEIINNCLPKDERIKFKTVGEGKNTTSLVNGVKNIQYIIDNEVKKRILGYEKIFVAFDRDSFSKKEFNKAIELCEKNDYIALWSNEAIELWFLLHFNLYDYEMSRENYEDKLNKEFKNLGLKNKYSKTDKSVIDLIIEYGSLENAIRNAKKIYKKFQSENLTPSDSCSCTTIFRFFDEINERNKERSLPTCDEIFKQKINKKRKK